MIIMKEASTKPKNKQIPYISFPVKEIFNILGLINQKEPIDKSDLINKIALKIKRKEKTSQEIIISLRNLGLIKMAQKKVELTDRAKNIEDVPTFKKFILNKKYVKDMIKSIHILEERKVFNQSTEDYFSSLLNVLEEKFNYKKVALRVIDRFITLFRFLKIIDYDNFMDRYYIVNDNISKGRFKKEIKNVYKGLLSNKTTWVRIPQLRSNVISNIKISRDKFKKLFIDLLDSNKNFEVASASIVRDEVKKFGLKKDKKIYFYLKIRGS